MEHGLKIEGLAFSYPGGPELLRGADLRVLPGRCAAVTGGNGAGKSTLVKIAAGIIPNFQRGELRGYVAAGGREGVPPAAVLQDLDSQLLRDTVGAELSFFLKYGGLSASPAEAARGMGIEGLLPRETATLSSGQKQRFLLACGLYFSGGGTVILDEPNAFLDAEARALLAVKLSELKSAGRSILLAGHDFTGFDAVIDDWYTLEGGRLVPGRPSRRERAPSRMAGAPGPARLRAEGLAYTHEGKDRLLEPSSLELRAGAMTGLVGANGSGKTTVARLLSGFYAPPEGAVLFDGGAAGRGWLKENVRLVSARPLNQLPGQTVEENLRRSLASAGRLAPLSLDEGVELAGLGPLLGRRVSRLSYGELQKVLALSSVLRAPEALLLDEPLLSLDAAGLDSTLELLGRFMSGGKGVLMISHMADLVGALCGRAYRMEGRAVRPAEV